ncbi:uncharacterized protein LOC131225321 [Magnolia sinica]|uniref:uncharacterized protein LOC131225321 n=1 Tax=Magnolia sinica TaxID=86752 RepID=UPI002657EE83|nr:uncharacterized protein LOC131225321 [Magnolia sinica]
MDSQPQALGVHLTETTDASKTKASSSSSRKRGPTRCAFLHEQPDRKKVLKTNEFGQPNEDCLEQKKFASHIGILTRTHIPIIYQDFRQVPHAHIQMIIESLSRAYEFEGQSGDASLTNVTKRIKETWQNYKKRLTAKYIKDKDPAVVRDSPAPPKHPYRGLEKLDELYSSNPSFKITDVDDALTQGLGCSITTIGLKMSAPARSKVENLIKEKDGLVQEIFDIKKLLAKMEAWMQLQQHAQSTQNLLSPTIAKSAQPDVIYIGRRCDLLSWGNRDVVARG